ncbi:MAG: ABC transporter permease [Ilumatobacteraceae bacterium]
MRRAVLFVAALLTAAALWELYKLVGPERGGEVFGWSILPRSNDIAMPHVWDMLSRYTEPDRQGTDRQIWRVVLAGTWYSFRLAVLGFVLGVAVGLGLAVLMARFRVVERGLLPYLVVSQTVPLIALAPLIATWGGRVHVGDWVWPRWLSASVIGAFLAFFPVAVGSLRGLKSPPAASMELMDSYAATFRQSLFKLRFPAAVPFIVTSMKLAATASVVGVIVAEISTGLRGGVGRLILTYAGQVTGDPTKLYTAVFGAAALGLVMAGLVTLLDVMLMRNRPKERVEALA